MTRIVHKSLRKSICTMSSRTSIQITTSLFLQITQGVLDRYTKWSNSSGSMLMVPGANWWLAAQQQSSNISDQKLSLNSNLINTSVVSLTSSETDVPTSETVKLTSLPINTSNIDGETSPSLISTTIKEEEGEILPICPEEPPGLQVRELK